MAPSVLGNIRTSSIATSSPTRTDDKLISLRYEDCTPSKPPIPVTVAPPRAPPDSIHPALRRPGSSLVKRDDSKRDSGLAPTTSSKAREGSVNTDGDDMWNVLGVSINFNASPQTTNANLSPESARDLVAASMSKSKSAGAGYSSMNEAVKPSVKDNSPQTPPAKSISTSPSTGTPFSITTPIPTESLLEEDFLEQLSFSNRGSVMLGGKKAFNGHERVNVGRRMPSLSLPVTLTPIVLSEDIERESQKVRSMYETGTDYNWREGDDSPSESWIKVDATSLDDIPQTESLKPRTALNKRPESVVSTRREHELAGGIEDWEDVNGHDVDRYGFISLQKRRSRPGTPEPRPPQRVSTVLQLASETPRKRRSFGRNPSTARRSPPQKKPTKSLKTQNTHETISSQRSTRSGIRAAANRLPGNKDRRWMDEAGDMLTLPPGLADIAENEEGGKAVNDLKTKEWERSEKWRKMAKVLKNGADGQGMEFEFDTRSPKLIDRTWKGIPDRWRSAAWFSFLNTSAKKRKDSPTIDQLVGAYHKLQDMSSADDMQIDIDVPRTINSHIMFRKRYRGGQRLLFRVLHALTLFFPGTGYVQGMASLAATLLCYYDEEKTFIMLTRMWTLRGLDKLYEAGFSGLMAALDEFQKQWLEGGEVSKKLDEFSIDPTAYGTRWYLTLFNYSIPFPAQLRVWDVFMLLGDSDLTTTSTAERPFGGGLDVLHATSAALIDGTREILLDSDFENAMKVLTSWIPVKDEELLMKVARAEWKLHRGKRKI